MFLHARLFELSIKSTDIYTHTERVGFTTKVQQSERCTYIYIYIYQCSPKWYTLNSRCGSVQHVDGVHRVHGITRITCFVPY
jgi:hypothetical protein